MLFYLLLKSLRKLGLIGVQIQYYNRLYSYFFLSDKSSDVKRIAIVGVHGWFPGKLVRAVVGKPMGILPEFCDMMAKAILGYLLLHDGIILPSDAITCIPLEGEGTTSTLSCFIKI